MADSDLVTRLQRPLAAVIVVVLSLASLSAFRYEPRAVDLDTDRSAATDGSTGTGTGDATAPVTAAPTSSDGSGVALPDDPADGSAPLGAAVVPAAGTYRYQVTVTSGAETSVQEEQRVIEILSGDQSTAVVQLSAVLAGENQVSVLDWSPAGAFVRSTRIEDASGPSRDCTWSPAFAEFGPLAAGSSWTLDSMCRTPVGGIDTTFTVTGSGRVAGEASVVDPAGVSRRVWQIERDRTTTIEAAFGSRTVTQQAREQGTILFDPNRGIVVSSDVTVTLSGSQSGTTRRYSVLQPD